MKQFDIDLVYLWCDGNDSKFTEQKDKLMQLYKADIQSNHLCRYKQINELKFSLRSVNMYMPWIHHIYIITNNQIPKWFQQHEKVTIVDHSQILPITAQPCYNSQALECCLHKIPNLSEHFIYANDDCFVGRKVSPSFFFDRAGRPIIRWKKTKLCTGLYWHTLKAAQNIIKKRFGISYERFEPHHNMDAYTKTIIKECEEEFPNLFHHTIHQPFRNESCLQRVLFHMHALIHKKAILKDITRTFFQRIMKKLRIAHLDSMYLNNSSDFKHIKPNHPTLFCINDIETSSDKDRANALNFLKKKFPHKSPFEQ